jgi:predicted enzyme related to lactoylglutathione lyase
VGARFDLVTLDAAEPERMARFWSTALDLVETEREDGDRWIVLSSRAGVRRIGLQRGRPRPGSVHLDLACSPDEFDSELARLVALGATVVAPARREPYGAIANLADPEGNPFDLCAYRTS